MKKTFQGRERERERILHVQYMYSTDYNPLLCNRLSICHSSLTHPQYQEPINIGELMGRIQEYVSAHRIRACEYFQDFDPLRSGFISTTRFRQVQPLINAHNITLLYCIVLYYIRALVLLD